LVVTEKAVKLRLKQLDMFLLDKYKDIYEYKRKNPIGYDIDFCNALKSAIKELNPLVYASTQGLQIYQGNGPKPKLDLKQKVTIILFKTLIEKSNRMMSCLLDVFLLLLGIDISYKSIERLYSDEDVYLALCNLNTLIIRQKKVEEIDASGDATGYSLTITKHYRNHAQRLKNKAKISKGKKKNFLYKFALMDLDSKMYVAYGTSLRSEKEAYRIAMRMLEKSEVSLKSIRLDRYYSNPGDINEFKGIKAYFIPKKNVTLGNGLYWNERLEEFVDDTFEYLKEYFRRNNSESAFATDKKILGWKINQKRADRMDTAVFCRVIWRNLFNLYR
jgi:transposase